MDTIINPYDDELNNCIGIIDELEEQLRAAKEVKNDVLTKMANFYTQHLKGVYFKNRYTKKIGQISHIFYKDGRFLVHLWVLEVTIKSKLVKRYINIELFGNEMKNLVQLSDSEYKQEFFDYVNKQIRTVESED